MEDLYPIARRREEGPKCRGRQSIKLRGRFEPQGDGLNAQLGRTFHTQKKKIWTTHVGGHTQGITVSNDMKKIRVLN